MMMMAACAVLCYAFLYLLEVCDYDGKLPPRTNWKQNIPTNLKSGLRCGSWRNHTQVVVDAPILHAAAALVEVFMVLSGLIEFTHSLITPAIIHKLFQNASRFISCFKMLSDLLPKLSPPSQSILLHAMISRWGSAWKHTWMLSL